MEATKRLKVHSLKNKTTSNIIRLHLIKAQQNLSKYQKDEGPLLKLYSFTSSVAGRPERQKPQWEVTPIVLKPKAKAKPLLISVIAEAAPKEGDSEKDEDVLEQIHHSKA